MNSKLPDIYYEKNLTSQNFKNTSFKKYKLRCDKHNESYGFKILLCEYGLTYGSCKINNCNLRIFNGIPGSNKPIVCDRHKIKGVHKNVVFQLCSYPDCEVPARQLLNGRCHKHKIDPKTGKMIEMSPKPEENVFEYIKNNINMNIKFNESMHTGWSTRYPDIFIKTKLGHAVIGEIDENQHKGYSKIEEENRIYQLLDKVLAYEGIESLVLIRFNPHSYLFNGVKVNSYWTHVNGKNAIEPKYISNWNARLNKLKETITYWLNNSPKQKLEIVYLYYDS
jgi:hypothetical protein